ncbi:hypothetical protein [Streptomyces sp. WM6372]|uniref:hypothetical protein n=1 Tax=Streptomyces sp. WM6372 TaxID=1415555 RepID=UPI000B1D6ABF|nr:hypothetical protein [Streptomyces sp. WM6372]
MATYDQLTERPSFGVEPETGAVDFVMPDGEAWFANSGVGVCLNTERPGVADCRVLSG